MDQLNNIYANVEELSKSSESVYENVFIDTLKPSRNRPSPSGVGDVKKRSFKAVAVILGLLSFFLLTGLITSVCLFTKGISEREMEMILLQTSNNNLTKERNQLQTRYTNMTNERDHFIKIVQNLDSKLNLCQRKMQANCIIYNQRGPYHSGMRSRLPIPIGAKWTLVKI